MICFLGLFVFCFVGFLCVCWFFFPEYQAVHSESFQHLPEVGKNNSSALLPHFSNISMCVCVGGEGFEEPIFFFLGLREGKNVRRREYYESGQIYHSTRTHGEWVEWGNTTKMDMHDLTMSIPKISCKDGRINSLFNTVYRCTEQTKSSIIIPCLSDSSLKIGV